MMNWEAIGAIGEIIGAIAVIGTIVYLARQIGQSVDLGRASQNRNLMESYEAYNELIIGSREVAELLARLEGEPTDLSPADNVQIRHLAYRMMNVWASAELSFINGQLRQDEFALYQNDVRSTTELYPGLVPYLVDNLNRYPAMKDFAIYVALRDRELFD